MFYLGGVFIIYLPVVGIIGRNVYTSIIRGHPDIGGRPRLTPEPTHIHHHWFSEWLEPQIDGWPLTLIKLRDTHLDSEIHGESWCHHGELLRRPLLEPHPRGSLNGRTGACLIFSPCDYGSQRVQSLSYTNYSDVVASMEGRIWVVM